jgi:cytochrome c oxidase assembly protein subunit 11
MASQQTSNAQQRSAATGFRLAVVVVAMFGFGFAMVPIYSVFCDLTGLNGNNSNTNKVASSTNFSVDEKRTVKVQFLGSINGATRMDFNPDVFEMEVHPGKLYTTNFFARNPLRQPMVGQAVPSVMPAKASLHFHKTECFCFTQQSFAAGESREMPVTFVIDPDLPKDIETVTLSYTFFDITQTANQNLKKQFPDGG